MPLNFLINIRQAILKLTYRGIQGYFLYLPVTKSITAHQNLKFQEKNCYKLIKYCLSNKQIQKYNFTRNEISTCVFVIRTKID
ncbi:hypothetical protein BpHYR1_034714 [Brachionus plicatilis]|uniref:Uncharacterized protein n=1 Tax=Brachionus plicatilis TaxID=10195 RepID=A0A3M7QCS4_BRAPC|nr:hypothetical protein BpHYR1_034714 [Brachionus plicatilis]